MTPPPAATHWAWRYALTLGMAALTTLIVASLVHRISGSSPEAAFFAGLFIAVPLVGGALFLASVAIWADRRRLMVLTVCPLLTAAAAMVLIAYDAFVWHIDPQNGLVVLFMPFFGGAGAGPGLLAGVLLARRRR